MEGESRAEPFEVLVGGGELMDSELPARPLVPLSVEILALLRLNSPMANVGVLLSLTLNGGLHAAVHQRLENAGSKYQYGAAKQLGIGCSSNKSVAALKVGV